MMTFDTNTGTGRRGRIRILPYRQGSRSAKALANALSGKILKLEGSTFIPRVGDFIINWGNTVTNPPVHGRPLNTPYAIHGCSNKRVFFYQMDAAGVSGYLPEYWLEAEDIPDDAFPVVCRTVLAGHSGEGIVMANRRDELVPAGLYTKYIKKQDEYRIHLGQASEEGVRTISIQRKARRLETPPEEINWRVRNHQNGFVYVRNGVDPPPSVMEAAYEVFDATGLDFGAVDVIYNSHRQQAFVLEVNCAPGLEGQTITDYATYFRSLL